MLYNIIDWFAWWLSDNKYDSDILEDVVQEVFGVRQHLFDVDSQHRTGIKVAITATTVSTCLLRIFTNYNGADRRRQGRGESWATSQSVRLTASRLCHLTSLRPFRRALPMGSVSSLRPLDVVNGVTN